MLGGGGGRCCIKGSLDGPDHFAIRSRGSESELLIGRTLGVFEADWAFYIHGLPRSEPVVTIAIATIVTLFYRSK
jgi:hypothetical protein